MNLARLTNRDLLARAIEELDGVTRSRCYGISDAKIEHEADCAYVGTDGQCCDISVAYDDHCDGCVGEEFEVGDEALEFLRELLRRIDADATAGAAA